MRILLMLLVSVLFTGCGDGSDDLQTNPQLLLLPLHAEPDILTGGAIVDAQAPVSARLAPPYVRHGSHSGRTHLARMESAFVHVTHKCSAT
jgi:hypothetical protein